MIGTARTVPAPKRLLELLPVGVGGIEIVRAHERDEELTFAERLADLAIEIASGEDLPVEPGLDAPSSTKHREMRMQLIEPRPVFVGIRDESQHRPLPARPCGCLPEPIGVKGRTPSVPKESLKLAET